MVLKMIVVGLPIFLVVISIAVLLGGWYAHLKIIDSNQCTMTYSVRDRSELELPKYNGSYKLWSVKSTSPNKATKQKKLASNAVLFVPGHFGR